MHSKATWCSVLLRVPPVCLWSAHTSAYFFVTFMVNTQVNFPLYDQRGLHFPTFTSPFTHLYFPSPADQRLTPRCWVMINVYFTSTLRCTSTRFHFTIPFLVPIWDLSSPADTLRYVYTRCYAPLVVSLVFFATLSPSNKGRKRKKWERERERYCRGI